MRHIDDDDHDLTGSSSVVISHKSSTERVRNNKLKLNTFINTNNLQNNLHKSK